MASSDRTDKSDDLVLDSIDVTSTGGRVNASSTANPDDSDSSTQDTSEQAGVASSLTTVPTHPAGSSAPQNSPAADTATSTTTATADDTATAEDDGHDDATAGYYDSDMDGNKPGGPDPWDVNGAYSLLIDSLRDRGELCLRIDDTTTPPRLWGSFVQGSMNGVLRALDITGIEHGDPITFTWRYINLDAGILRYGDACTGSLRGVCWTEEWPHGGVVGHFLSLINEGEILEFEAIWTDKFTDALTAAGHAEAWDDISHTAYLLQ